MHLRISGELRAPWKARIERLVELTLGPLCGTLKRPRLEFSETAPLAQGKHRYQCTFEASAPQGKHYRFSVQHRDGAVAVTSALVRARRAIMRDRLHNRKQLRS